MSNKTIACIGESMVEVAILPGSNSQAKVRFGGDTLNTAIYMARLGKQADFDVCYATLLGDDPYGDAMLQTWRDEEVCCRYVERLPNRETGLYMIHVDDQGERAFRYWRSSSPARELFEGESGLARIHALREVDGLFFTGITLAVLHPQSRDRLLELAYQFKQAGKWVAYDTNHRAQLWVVLQNSCIYKLHCIYAVFTYTELPNSNRLINKPMTMSCIFSSFEKQIVFRAKRLIRVRKVRCLRSIF